MDNVRLLKILVLLLTAPWWLSLARRIVLETWRVAEDAAEGSETRRPPGARSLRFDTRSLRSGWDREFLREERLINDAWLTGRRKRPGTVQVLLEESATERIWSHPGPRRRT